MISYSACGESCLKKRGAVARQQKFGVKLRGLRMGFERKTEISKRNILVKPLRV